MDQPEFVWLNDALLPLAQARVSVNDRGFLYGDGFFETLRAENGRPWFLQDHLDRLRASAHAFRIPFPEGFPWKERIRRVLAANGLDRGLARVRLQLTRGVAAGLGLPPGESPTVVIWAHPYEPPSPAEYAYGWPVVVFPQRRSTFIGRHKSLNYLFYLAARQYALDKGAREAVILEANGLVSEGAATNLVYLCKGDFCTPAAWSALPGVAVGMLAVGLALREMLLEEVRTPLSRLEQAEGIWLTNSLIGVMPVASINGEPVPYGGLTSLLQEALLSVAHEEL